MAFDSRAPKLSDETKQFTLRGEEELRIEVDADQQIVVTLLSGTAEIFGAELTAANDLTLTNIKCAVFSWHGCELSIKGTMKVAYTANETPMISYINTHAALDAMRQAAKQGGGRGPVALVCGPGDAGKSSLCKLLLSYAVRAGNEPLFIDLDVGQNSITIPGTLSATSIQSPVIIDGGNGDTLSVKAPLTFFYGHATPNQVDLYKQLVDRLAVSVTKRFTANAASRTSGAIINACGWIEGNGYDLLIHIATALTVDVIIVLGNERLYSELKADNRIHATLAKLAKSGGVVSRTANARNLARSQAIREYFYGAKKDLRPHTKIVPFKDCSIFRVGGGPQAPASALPIGAARLVQPNELSKVTPSIDLLHSILAVSYAIDPAAMLAANVAGFVYVTNVDIAKKSLTLLCPAPGPLPSTCFLAGTIKWHD